MTVAGPPLLRQSLDAIADGMERRSRDIDARLPPGVAVVDPHAPYHRGFWGAELATRPELLEPPRPVVGYFAWQGRVTLTAGADKVGKSTLWRQAAVAVPRGSPFLGQPTNGGRPGRVLWFGLEESLADIWRPFVGLGVDPARIYIVNSIDGMLGVRQAMDVSDRWVLVVIDTLAALGHACSIGSERDETEMTKLMQQIVRLARTPEPSGGPACGIVHHHTRGETPRERGTGAIPANCDVILNLAARRDDSGVIDVTGRARGGIEVKPFGLRPVSGTFELAPAGEAAAHDARAGRVLQLVTAEPGELTANAVAKRLGGSRGQILNSINRLLELGILMRDNGRLRPSGTPVRGGTRTGGTTQREGGTTGTPPKGGEYHRTSSTTVHTNSGAVPVADFDGSGLDDTCDEPWEPR